MEPNLAESKDTEDVPKIVERIGVFGYYECNTPVRTDGGDLFKIEM